MRVTPVRVRGRVRIFLAVLSVALTQLWAEAGLAETVPSRWLDNGYEVSLVSNASRQSYVEREWTNPPKIVPVVLRTYEYRRSESEFTRLINQYEDLIRALRFLLLIGVIIFFAILLLRWRQPQSSRNAAAALQNTADGALSEFRESPWQSGNFAPQVTDQENALQPYAFDEPAPQSMLLKLKRSQRATNIRGTIIFVLDARIALSPEEYSLVKRYRLGGLAVYDSRTRAKHTDAVMAQLEMAREQASAGKTFLRLGRASLNATMAAFALRITVDRLISGVHIECKSMDEMLGAENAILEAGRNLKAYMETARTFDGREEIIEL